MTEEAFANVDADGVIYIETEMDKDGTLCAFSGPRADVEACVAVTARHGYNAVDGKGRDPNRPPIYICAAVRDAQIGAPGAAYDDPAEGLEAYAAWATKNRPTLTNRYERFEEA